jgi:thiol-disulfide isomerase/thioredoxin
MNPMNPMSTPRPTQAIGSVMPDIALPLICGSSADLDNQLQRNKGLLVLFWSETCSHCLRYDPYFKSFAEKHLEIGLIAIASRQGETAERIAATVAKRGLPFPVLHDRDGAVAKQWFTQQTPRVFLLDAQRKLLYRGAIDNYLFAGDPEYQAYLEPALEAYLAGRPIERNETASFGCAIQSVYYILPKPVL